MDVNAESNRFITIKGHKENSLNHLKVCLINSAKNELGRTSKTIIDKINMKLFKQLKSTNRKTRLAPLNGLIH